MGFLKDIFMVNLTYFIFFVNGYNGEEVIKRGEVQTLAYFWAVL
jgi:hypothetical protein